MKSETKLFLGIILATVAIIGGAIFFLGKTPQSVKVDNSLLVRDDSPRTGAKTPTVTVVEFGDFQCPACGAYHPIVSQLLKDFPNDILLVFRHYPLDSLHVNAHIGAQAAEAAGKQGKFWEMYDLLYTNQKDWSDSKNPRDVFAGYAKTMGIDVAKFTKDIDADDILKKISRDVADGDAVGIAGTPTFFINGEKIANPASLADFEDVIKAAIAKAPKPTGSKEEAYHAHANIAVYVNGARIDFSQAKYQSEEGKELNSFIHFHDGNGNVVHLHKAGMTLAILFQSFSLDLSKNVMRLFVNGKENSALLTYVPQDLDRILLTDTKDEATVQKQIAAVTDDACIYSEKCPQRGTPPTENCVGGLGTDCAK